MSIFCTIDDKHVPLYRVMWVAATAHFCGHEDCQAKASTKSAWSRANRFGPRGSERDEMLTALEGWQGGIEPDDEHFE